MLRTTMLMLLMSELFGEAKIQFVPKNICQVRAPGGGARVIARARQVRGPRLHRRQLHTRAEETEHCDRSRQLQDLNFRQTSSHQIYFCL